MNKILTNILVVVLLVCIAVFGVENVQVEAAGSLRVFATADGYVKSGDLVTLHVGVDQFSGLKDGITAYSFKIEYNPDFFTYFEGQQVTHHVGNIDVSNNTQAGEIIILYSDPYTGGQAYPIESGYLFSLIFIPKNTVMAQGSFKISGLTGLDDVIDNSENYPQWIVNPVYEEPVNVKIVSDVSIEQINPQEFKVVISDIDLTRNYQIWAYEIIESTIFDDELYHHDNWKLVLPYTLGSAFVIDMYGNGSRVIPKFESAGGNYTIAVRVSGASGEFKEVIKDTFTDEQLGNLKISKIALDGEITGRSTIVREIKSNSLSTIEIITNDVGESDNNEYTLQINGRNKIIQSSNKFTLDFSGESPGEMNVKIGVFNTITQSNDEKSLKFILFSRSIVYPEIQSLKIEVVPPETTPAEPDPTGTPGGEPTPTLAPITSGPSPTPGEPQPTNSPEPSGIYLNISPEIKNTQGAVFQFRISEPWRKAIRTSGEYNASQSLDIVSSVLSTDEYGIFQLYSFVKLNGRIQDGIIRTVENLREGTYGELVINVPDTINNGQSINITASVSIPSVDSSKIEYSFWRRDARGWVLVRDYEKNPLWNWTPARIGDYTIQVRAKGPGAVSYEVIANKEIEVTGSANKASVVSSTLNDLSMVQARIPVEIFANVESVNNDLMYKFIISNGFNYYIETQYSLSPAYIWVPGKSGPYRISLLVKNSTSYGKYDYSNTFTIDVSE